ncbi:MAG: DNA-binding domain-containing protein [Candidatus Binatia bacterium]
MPNLIETEDTIWRLISAPDAAACRGVGGLVRGDERLGAAERIGIYAEMYFLRLLDCLAEDFAAVHAVVGHERFHAVVADYLAAHPSEHFSLRQLGSRLASFLERHPSSESWFFLPDLARFEWALLDAFDAPDAEPLPAERLAELPPEEWAEARFRLTPSLRVIAAGAPVQEVWKAAAEQREITPPARRPTVVRIWRQDFRVFHRTIEPLERAVLRDLGEGREFGAVCESAAALVDEADAAAGVVAVLRRWFADGMIVGCETAG